MSAISRRAFAGLVAVLVVGWSLVGGYRSTLVVAAGLAAGYALWPAIQARRDVARTSDTIGLVVNVSVAALSFVTLLLFLQFEGGLPVLLGAGILAGALVASQFRGTGGAEG